MCEAIRRFCPSPSAWLSLAHLSRFPFVRLLSLKSPGKWNLLEHWILAVSKHKPPKLISCYDLLQRHSPQPITERIADVWCFPIPWSVYHIPLEALTTVQLSRNLYR